MQMVSPYPTIKTLSISSKVRLLVARIVSKEIISETLSTFPPGSDEDLWTPRSDFAELSSEKLLESEPFPLFGSGASSWW